MKRTAPAPARALLILLLFVGCSSTEDPDTLGTSRQQVDGYELVEISGMNAVEPVVLEPAFTIGSADGEDPYLFGTIKGIDADSNGNIYILDSQASEIRVFSPTGQYIKTIGSRGAGPGEIDESNGFMILPDDTIWLYDHGQFLVKVFDREGIEIDSHPTPIKSYAWVWSGTVDNRSRIWKGSSRPDSPPVFPPKDGFNEHSGTAFMIQYDTQAEVSDTTWLGRVSGRSYVMTSDRGYRSMGLLYGPTRALVVSPDGDGFWKADGYGHAFARLSADTDTTMMVKTDLEPVPITDEDKARFIEAAGAEDENLILAAKEIVGAMPDNKPAVQNLILDDESRVWLKRYSDPGEVTTMDVFSSNGEYVKSVRINSTIVGFNPIRIKDNRLYSIEYREDGVPTALVVDLQ